MKHQTYSFRRAVDGDAEALIEFNCCIARETEGKELPRDIVTRGVKRGLQQGDEAVYYVAECASGIIGCLMLTREWSDWRDGWLVWIQSVYVVKDYRGQGIFRGLLSSAMDAARENPDVIGVRLYVEQDNTQAQTVYLRSGFSDPNYKVLERMF